MSPILLASLVLIGIFSWSSISAAAFFSFPRIIRSQINQLEFREPTLAPIAHTAFCLRYPDDCKSHLTDFRRRYTAFTLERLTELNSINRQINRDIIPERNFGGLATEKWLISPGSGDCNDYAVTKRHELLLHGWPPRALLLAEVIVPSGEHHLVLVVRLKDDQMNDLDLVLDNLSAIQADHDSALSMGTN